jgi:hypothetical protein
LTDGVNIVPAQDKSTADSNGRLALDSRARRNLPDFFVTPLSAQRRAYSGNSEIRVLKKK